MCPLCASHVSVACVTHVCRVSVFVTRIFHVSRFVVTRGLGCSSPRAPSSDDSALVGGDRKVSSGAQEGRGRWSWLSPQ